METICALVAIRSINQQLLTRAENNTTQQTRERRSNMEIVNCWQCVRRVFVWAGERARRAGKCISSVEQVRQCNCTDR